MFKHSTSKVSNDHVNQIVKSILTKRQKNVVEQQQTFIRRNTDENNKRNNYLVDKFTVKKQTKENQMMPTPKLISPKKKKTTLEIFDDDENDFISSRKRPKLTESKKEIVPKKPRNNPVNECLESIVTQIENNDATCPICNKILSNLVTIDQRQEHVNHCLEQSQFNNIETKQQKTLLAYSKFSSTSSTRKPLTTTTTSNLKCQICGMSFNAKRTYLTHLKKCSNQNSVQLKHVVNFAAKTSEVNETNTTKKKSENHIKNRVIKMEMPMNEDDEQQQLAIALSASIKTATEPPNAFEVLQAAAKKIKTIDLQTTPLWNISIEDRLKLSSTRLANLCERVIITNPSTDTYQFPPSTLLFFSQTNFGPVNWWNITTTDPQDEEIPMSQLARMLHENDEDDRPVI